METKHAIIFREPGKKIAACGLLNPENSVFFDIFPVVKNKCEKCKKALQSKNKSV